MAGLRLGFTLPWRKEHLARREAIEALRARSIINSAYVRGSTARPTVPSIVDQVDRIGEEAINMSSVETTFEATMGRSTGHALAEMDVGRCQRGRATRFRLLAKQRGHGLV